MPTAIRCAQLLTLAAIVAAIWLGSACESRQGARAAAVPSAPTATEGTDPPRALLMAGQFTAARDAYRASVQAGGREAAAAQRDLPFLEAVAFGTFDASHAALGNLHAAAHDFESIARIARLLALRGERVAALERALQAVALAAPPYEKAELLQCVLAGMDPSEAVDRACRALLALDPWSAVARSALFRSAVLGDDFAAARASWRDLHWVDLLTDELYDANAAAIEALFEPAAAEPAARWQLGRALAGRGRWREAAHCLRDATEAASSACRARAERFFAFAQTFDSACIDAYRAGLADGGAKRVLNTALPKLCELLGVATVAQLYATLRDDYGLYLVLLSSGPLNLDGEATEILQSDAPQLPETLRRSGTRRLVTGAPRFRMSWALSPLTLGAGTKDVFRSDWPDTIVLHASYSIAQAAEAHEVSKGVRSDPAADLAPMSDPAAPPRSVASAFMVGNQGNRCFQRMRELAAKAAMGESGLVPGDSQQWRDAFVGFLTAADLRAATLHEMCHIHDHALGGVARSERELRAFLTELEFAPVAARYLRLGIIATGGVPSATGDPYETANFELLAGFITTLATDTKLAPQVDRASNLQAQLHRLEAEEIAEIARRIGASRSRPRK